MPWAARASCTRKIAALKSWLLVSAWLMSACNSGSVKDSRQARSATVVWLDDEVPAGLFAYASGRGAGGRWYSGASEVQAASVNMPATSRKNWRHGRKRVTNREGFMKG